MKQLPNLLSCFRIALSIALLSLMEKPVLFTIVYLLCGISDVLDGYLARLMNAKTALGIKLDSLGDLFFYVAWLFILFTFPGNGSSRLITICVIMVAIIRMVNLAITKVKFKQWGIIHTVGNKFTGFILFLILPVFVFVGDILPWSIVTVGVIATLSALEENVILLKSEIYDANRRSILTCQIRALRFISGNSHYTKAER